MKLSELLKSIEPADVAAFPEREVTAVVSDSRQVRPGSVFVAVPGMHADGWSFVEEAAGRGAVAIVSEHSGNGGKNVCKVRVGDAREALARLSSAFHGRPADTLRMIGITGTNGKTTTAYMVRDALRADGRNPGLISTVEYEIGARVIPAARTTPEPSVLQSALAEMVHVGCRDCVMEVSSHALAQQRTAGIDFDIAVFTNLTRDHLDYHGTMAEYFEAKMLLFRDLGKGSKKAVAVANVDDEWGRKLVNRIGGDAELFTYGMDREATVQAHEIELTPHGSTFRVVSPWGETSVSSALLGRYNISNMLAAIAACGAGGMALEFVAGVLSGITAVRGRLEEIRTRQGFQVFVDYAHTDDALEHVLTTLREITRNRLLLVFGCGGNRDTSKRPTMGEIASKLADHSILTSDNPRNEDPAEIIEQIRNGFGQADNYEIIEDRGEAIRKALSEAGDGDVVLVAGKGHESFQEFANTTVSFDDRQVVREAVGAG